MTHNYKFKIAAEIYEFKLILCKLPIEWHTMCKLSIQDGHQIFKMAAEIR